MRRGGSEPKPTRQRSRTEMNVADTSQTPERMIQRLG